MYILKVYRSHSYVTYSNYNRVISDSNNINLIKNQIYLFINKYLIVQLL